MHVLQLNHCFCHLAPISKNYCTFTVLRSFSVLCHGSLGIKFFLFIPYSSDTRQVRHSNSRKFEIKDSNERVRAWQCFKHFKIPKEAPDHLTSTVPVARTLCRNSRTCRGKEPRGILLQWRRLHFRTSHRKRQRLKVVSMPTLRK